MTALDPGAADERPWVIMLSGSPWAARAHRQQALARELAVDYRVLYVDPPSNGVSHGFAVTPVAPSIWHVRVPSPLPAGRQVAPVNQLARRVVARRLRRWLESRPGTRLLWVDEDLAAPVIGRLGEEAVVYDATDLDWSFTRPWNRAHLRRGLRSAVGQADLVLVSSSALPAHLPPSRRPPVVAANACDPEPFARPGTVPPWLSAVDRPRLGYVGAVDTRALDLDLVVGVARLRPEWTFVLVGPTTRPARSALGGLANVIMSGPVPYADVPPLLAGFDVGLIPYRVGGVIDYVHPKKTYEYLAAGLPVVATPLPALADLARTSLAGLVRLASTPEAFVGATELALLESAEPAHRRRRRQAAAENSWAVRGDQVRALLRELWSSADAPSSPGHEVVA